MTDTVTDVNDNWDRIRRWQLTGAALCWSCIAVSMYALTDQFLYLPDIVAFFAALSAICTVIVLVRPGTVFAFRYGGTLAEGTLFLLGASLVLGLAHIEEPQLVWIVTSAVGLLAMLGFTYANWWLYDLKHWHQAHRLSGH